MVENEYFISKLENKEFVIIVTLLWEGLKHAGHAADAGHAGHAVLK